MTIIHQHLMFIGAYFSIIMGIGQFMQKNKPFAGYIYGISFISMGLWIFHISSYSTGIFNDLYPVNLILIPFGFISAPIMSFRYQWLISQTLVEDRRAALYLLPALFSICIIIYPLFDLSIILREEYLVSIPIFSRKYLEIPFYFRIVQLLYFLPKLYLVVFMIFKLRLMTDIWKGKKDPKTIVPRAGFIFALNIIFSTALTGLGDLFSTGLITWSILYVNATFIAVFIFGQRNPEYNKVIKTEIIKRHYEKSKIKYIDVDSVLEELYYIMEDQKAFASEDISIKVIADELGITVHQLSEILNKKVKKNFNSFINDYRIEESKKILLEEPDRTITSVAMAVGFNSNTSFSTIFSKTTGLTPKEYRKKMNEF
jgi:AraC-like DNA-binding protein